MKKIKVLYEDKNILALDKPAGISVHGDGKTKMETITDYILKNYKNIKGVGEDMIAKVGGKEVVIPRPGIVHRLDKDTTGVLLIAKTPDTYTKLKHQFSDHKVKKEYLALVWGNIKRDTGIIDAKIAQSKNDFRRKETVKVSDESTTRGVEREAVTRYKVVERKKIFGEAVTLVTFYPESGRMHQIRVHAKSIGHPIIGDHLYGPTKPAFEKKFFGKSMIRQLLHARVITFHMPKTGEVVRLESSIPKDFRYEI
jgi:23S rRNA pseudouridine1911/1915/1917 synthase